MTGLRLETLDGLFSVCRISDFRQIDWLSEFLFIGKTDDELSLVCRTENAPDGTIRQEDGWRAFRIAGELDFSLIGILADVARILADEGISIFAVSTYNTDYVLIKQETFSKAMQALADQGYEVGQR